MKKVLLALLGFILIGILTYFCFVGKVDTIRQNLETNANSALINNNLLTAKAGLIGNSFETTTIMKLTGEVLSVKEKEKAEHLAGSILGVSGIDNQLTIKQVYVAPIPKEPKIEKVQIETPTVPSPYLFDASKDKEGKVLLSGYVDSKESHLSLVAHAYKIFGEQNTTDQLQVAYGAPENWEDIAHFSLEKLKEVDYGDMKLHDNNYAFNGHISSPKADKIKLALLKNAQSTMEKYNTYLGNFEISIPQPKPVEMLNSKLCQKALIDLSAKQKILFEYNKADIKKDNTVALDNMLKVLKKCKFKKKEILEIGGHTDSIGNAPFNKKLSQKRADSVKEYLIKHGIDKNILKAHGYGEKAPIVSNMLKAGRAKNRRIEFTIKGIK
jgi:outer membrane protein OmpA-like peptidoglycan-associated protein